MKFSKKRLILAISCAALLVLSVALTVAMTMCGEAGPTALEYDGVTVTEEMYLYWLAHYKAVFLDRFTGAEDTDAFWSDTLENGMTAEEYFTEVAHENIKKNIAAAWLFDYMGLRFTSEMKKDIKNGIEDMKVNLAGGDEEEFAAMLAEYGITEDTLYDIYVMDTKVTYLYDYLYGSGGALDISDEDKLTYTNENYVRIQHIYVNNNFKYVTVENELGSFTHDPETGVAYTEELTEEEKAEKNATVEAIDGAISGGEAFEEVWAEYSEDKLYENGYYLTEDSTFISEVVEAAFELEVGETARLETEYGVHYIKRYEITGTPWDDEESDEFFYDFDTVLADYIYTVQVSEIAEKVKVFTEITDKYKLREVKPNYYI